MKKTIALIILSALVMSMFAGCSGGSSQAPSQSTSASPSESTADQPSVEASEKPEAETEAVGGLPLTNEKKTLSLFVTIPDNIKQYFTDVQELDGYIAAEEMTNVQIKTTAVSNDVFKEQFNLMIASGEYTDMMREVNTAYSGGLTRALTDEVIIDLSDLLNEYGQDYLSYTNVNDTVSKSVITDDGKYLAVYSIATQEIVEQGWLIRQDYLDAVGMDIPTTVDEWEQVLFAFRDQLGLSDPLLIQSNLYSIASAFGSTDYMAEAASPMNYATWLYNENGTVKSCFTDGKYYNFLEKMNYWYSEGLIGSDFFSYGGERDDTYKRIYFNGDAGIFWSNNLQECGDLNSYAQDGVELSPMSYPVETAGDINQFGAKRELVRSISLSISGQCEDPALAMKWINFWFSDEGYKLANYGIQGKSWDYDAAGNWYFTDLIMNNPDGLSQMEARTYYTFGSVPCAIDPTTGSTTYGEWEWNCVDVWADSSTAAYRLLSVHTLDTDESETYNACATTIETYGAENIIKFVTGDLSLENDWAAFESTCIELGVNDCIEAYQGAVTRFESR